MAPEDTPDSSTTQDITQLDNETLKKRICVIGAGPAGLGALQIITESPQYKAGLWEPVAFEAREDIGGVWLPAPPIGDPPRTPMYDSLTTNHPHTTMAYRSFPFPPETPLFPHAPVVLKYLHDYTAHFDLYKHVKLGTTVRLVDWDVGLAQWHVRTSPTDSTSNGPGEELVFDLVIVANGHYNKPYYPPTPGLSAWVECGKAVHAAWYRQAHYVGETVLVIGAGPSGRDVAREMAAVCKTVIHSYADAPSDTPANDVLQPRPRIVEFLDPAEGIVLFADGTTASNVSHCIVATGYEHSLPFLPPSLLERGFPPSFPPIPSKLYNSGLHLFPLAKQLFPLTTAFPPSRMCFLSLPYYGAPLCFAEAQTRAMLKVFADPQSLDIEHEANEIAARLEQLRAETGDDERAIARLWHKMGVEQFAYRDELHRFVGGEYTKPKYMVPSWVVEVWRNLDVLRAEWKELVRTGEAEWWVSGVGRSGGERGEMEWVEMTRRLFKRAEARMQLQASQEPVVSLSRF